MWGYFCIGFIDFMLNGKSLFDYTNLFSLNDYEKNDRMIFKYFQQLKRWKNCIVLFVTGIANLRNLHYHTFYKKRKFFLLFAASTKMREYLKMENQLKY